MNTAMYAAKKPQTASIIRSGIGLLPILIMKMAFGCIKRFISRIPCLKINKIRITFIPPPVEPAQAPMKLENSNSNGIKPGQLWYSAVVKPVVVAIETV